MRLFVSVNFDKETVDHLYKSAEVLRQNSISANISHRENLHLTLARQLTAYEDFDKRVMDKVLCRKTVTVSKISLMRSDRIKGRLTYTEIFSKELR